MTSPHINDVRQHLMDTLAAMRDRDNPMDVDRAHAIAQVTGLSVSEGPVD